MTYEPRTQPQSRSRPARARIPEASPGDDATGQEEIVKTSSDLAQHMIENIEFVITVLKDYGGMDVRFERLKNARPAKMKNSD